MRLDTEITSRCQTVPGWISCDQAVSSSSVWSSVVTAQMASHARVLALSILDTWDLAQGPAPDLRLVIIEPSQLDTDTLASLREAGWGLCHIEMPDYMKVKGKDILSVFPFLQSNIHILLKFELKFLSNLQESIKEYLPCKGGDHPAVHAVLQQVVCLEHDDV